jgi:hypothetical protein
MSAFTRKCCARSRRRGLRAAALSSSAGRNNALRTAPATLRPSGTYASRRKRFARAACAAVTEQIAGDGWFDWRKDPCSLGRGERTVMEDSAMTEWRCDDGRRKIAYRPIARRHDVLASSDSSSVANAKFRSGEMSKLTRSIEDAQWAMTNVLSVTALTLSGLLVLVLAERYL